MPDTEERFHCEVCDQHVLASRWGFGPWCNLYFGERGQACLPRTLSAIAWLQDEGRLDDANTLKAWAHLHWDLVGVALP